MQFLNPQLLWLLSLGLVPLMLYLFRRKSKSVRVSTLVFFKTLAKEHQESAWLRLLKKWLSFALTLLILSFVVFVLARLIAKQDDPEQFRSVVILLDRSASMAVEGADGESRLEEAKRVLRQRLESVPEEVGVALIAYDVRPEVLQPRTLKRRELVSRLEEVEVRPMAGRSDLALEAAELIGGLETPAVVWHCSDRPLPASVVDGETDDRRDDDGDEDVGAQSTEVAVAREGIELRELDLALESATNTAITAFQIRPVPLEHSRYDIYVQVSLNRAASAPVQTRLEISVGGIPSQYRELELEPGDRTGVTFRINGVSRQLLQVNAVTEGDVFPLDDQATIPLPEARPLLAAWIRPDDEEDPYTRLALSSIQESGSFELLKGSPSAWPLTEEVDAVIFDGWLPAEWPEDLPVVVINPPDSSGPVFAKALAYPIPYDSIRAGNEKHPVLFRVSSGRVALTQTAVFQSAGSLEPLWFAGGEPVLSAGEVGGQRIVLMGFSPGRSERLPLTASFPILMGNALLWCVDRSSMTTAGADLYATGELVQTGGESITWSQWDGSKTQTRRIPLGADVVEMDRIGVWETDTGRRGAAHLLSAAESDLPVRAMDSDGSDPGYFAAPGGLGGKLKLWLLGVVILFLLTESWLFHRHAVY